MMKRNITKNLPFNPLFLFIFLTLFFLFQGSVAYGQSSTTITFENPVPAPVSCGDTWTENGVSMQIDSIDGFGFCGFTYGNGEIGMSPAKMTLDISQFQNITEISFVVRDDCVPGSWIARIYNGGTELGGVVSVIGNGNIETMTWENAGGLDVNSVSIENGCEGIIQEIVIQYNPPAPVPVIANISELPISINATGASSHPSAMLDIQSTDKGILIPRMATAQRSVIASPATGLLVFDTDTGSFWFYDGTAWADLSSDSGDADTDWTETANGIYHNTGNVAINTSTINNNSNLYIARPSGDYGASKAGIYAYRAGAGDAANGGSSWSIGGVDAAIKGYSFYGNNYTAGVAGLNYLDYDKSAGVIGAKYNGDIFGALAYKDDVGKQWAGYFDGDVQVKGKIDITEGLTFPRYSDSEIGNITPVQGQCIYNTTTTTLECYDGSAWQPLAIAEDNVEPDDIAFGALLNGDIILSSNEVQIQPFVESYDLGANFDSSTGEFEAPVDGIYLFNLKLTWRKESTDVTEAPVLIRLRVNGSPLGQIHDRITLRSDYGQDTENSFIFNLQQGDIVSAHAKYLSGGDVEIDGSAGSAVSRFSGIKIN